jgi:hypothetical protein
MSRRTQSSGMSAGASNDFGSPLIVSVVAISPSNSTAAGSWPLARKDYIARHSAEK